MSDTGKLPILDHFIDGKRTAGAGNRFGDIHDPAGGQVQAHVPFATPAEVDAAVQAASTALPAWSRTPPSQRARILFRYRDLLESHRDELARLCASEHGKTLDDARGSVTRGIEIVEFACGIPQLLKGEINENVAGGVDSYSLRQPLGVCVGITPFNFPAMVPMWMYPIALACGNTFVLKPSEKDPSCGLRLAELAVEAGIPAGVLNVVNGDKETVDALLNHPDVAAVSFVGSTPIAEYVHRTGTAAGKRVQALGGAKNHLVVMPDADMEQVTDALIGAAYGSAGERCMAVSVAVAVGEDTADALIDRLKPRVESLKIGPFDGEGVEMGPLVTKEHRDKVKGYVDSGVAEGADLVVDGRQVKVPGHEEGFFIGGCILDRVTPQMKVYKEEIFGPVLSVVRAKDYEEAVRLVNEHELGNGAAIFTRDGDAARDFTHRVEIGMVGVNVPIPVPTAYYSFGGWKRSLFGDHSMHGPEGVRFFTRLKTVTSRWPSGIREGAVFNFKRSTEA
ncbi:CoA-acylating methylmalonate-semialdehyde dehydrogenase [Thioalkalivibrio sp. HK1]|uniref:CoA-acylating methylmalonate-semialdehyde dehydrogenase n=1 Tax=Thioalkalivibrio sp. HK1 TaxID=1469245 RepID=UPI0004713810|nr:CoA-acylating methylmalonate-semialdehyde dehydrogenase [Thioalkalivibrio sp. HK1]